MKVNKKKMLKVIVALFLVIVVIVVFSKMFIIKEDTADAVIEIPLTENESEANTTPNLEEVDKTLEEEFLETDVANEFEPITEMKLEEDQVEQGVSDSNQWAVNSESAGTTPKESIYYLQDLEYDEIFQNAKEINVGYNINQYKFELIDANPSYMLFIVNPRVLVLYDVYNEELLQIDTEVSGGSISDDGQFLVYYKNDSDKSQAFYFNLVNKKTPIGINSFENGEIGDIQMIEGSIYITYNDIANVNEYSIVSYPMMNSSYEIPYEQIVKFGKIGKDLYVDKNNKLYFYNSHYESLSTVKVGELTENVKDVKNMLYVTPIAELLYEGGDVYSILLSDLYINGEETEYTDVSSMTYYDGKLYFVNDVFLHSYDGKEFKQHAIHRYVDKIAGSQDSLYITTLENEIYKLK